MLPLYSPGWRSRESMVSHSCFVIPGGISTVPFSGISASARTRNPYASTNLTSCREVAVAGAGVVPTSRSATVTDSSIASTVALVRLKANSPHSFCNITSGASTLLDASQSSGSNGAQGFVDVIPNGDRPVAARYSPITRPILRSSWVNGRPRRKSTFSASERAKISRRRSSRDTRVRLATASYLSGSAASRESAWPRNVNEEFFCRSSGMRPFENWAIVSGVSLRPRGFKPHLL